MDPYNEEDIKMYFFENRLKTFEGWPFDEDCKCTPENELLSLMRGINTVKDFYREIHQKRREDCRIRLSGSALPTQMAKAGFIHTPSENSPDIAMCFFCLKELEGWEPEDDPQKEHKSHSPSCHFIALKKKVEELTVEEFFKLQKEKHKFILNKSCNENITKFEEAAKLRRADIIKTATGEE